MSKAIFLIISLFILSQDSIQAQCIYELTVALEFKTLFPNPKLKEITFKTVDKEGDEHLREKWHYRLNNLGFPVTFSYVGDGVSEGIIDYRYKENMLLVLLKRTQPQILKEAYQIEYGENGLPQKIEVFWAKNSEFEVPSEKSLGLRCKYEFNEKSGRLTTHMTVWQKNMGLKVIKDVRPKVTSIFKINDGLLSRIFYSTRNGEDAEKESQFEYSAGRLTTIRRIYPRVRYVTTYE